MQAKQEHSHDHGHDHGHSHDHHHDHSHVVPLRPDAPAAVRLHNLTVAYRGHPAVHHLSGSFVAGQLTAVVGPNGAGKSSLLSALAGMAQHVEGRIELDPALRVAYLPQAAELDRQFPVRVHEVVACGLWAGDQTSHPSLTRKLSGMFSGMFTGLSTADRLRITQALAAVGLQGFEQRLLGELSAGQVQRVLFARVLVQDAHLILLDEPFNAIDARTTADLLALLQRWRLEARTVVAVLHDMQQVHTHFEQTLLLAREPVAWGPTAQVLKAEHLFKARQMAEAWDDSAHACERAA
jgi:zinc/manganese transport system ATP-binding protein